MLPGLLLLIQGSQILPKKVFYLTYLFSVDCSKLYLSIAFSITPIWERFGQGKEALIEIEKCSKKFLDIFNSSKENSKIKNGKINLNATQNEKRHWFYQSSSIFYIEYDVKNLPEEIILKNDYLEILKLYKIMVENPISTIPFDELIADKVTKSLLNKEPKVKDFEIRIKKTAKKVSSSKGSGNSNRVSKQSVKVGTEGEEIVWNYEIKKLSKYGIKDADKKVIWHLKEKKDSDRKPGWDITSYDLEGKKIFIEVKSSTGQKIDTIILTKNEYLKLKQTENYQFYLVTNVRSKKKSPIIEIIKNPLELINKDQISDPKPYSYELKFFKK